MSVAREVDQKENLENVVYIYVVLIGGEQLDQKTKMKTNNPHALQETMHRCRKKREKGCQHAAEETGCKSVQ